MKTKQWKCIFIQGEQPVNELTNRLEMGPSSEEDDRTQSLYNVSSAMANNIYRRIGNVT